MAELSVAAELENQCKKGRGIRAPFFQTFKRRQWCECEEGGEFSVFCIHNVILIFTSCLDYEVMMSVEN